MQAQFKSTIIINRCNELINEVEATRSPRIDALMEKLKTETITTGMLWWKNSRTRTPEEVTKTANHRIQHYPEGRSILDHPSLIDEINDSVDRRINKVDRIKNVAATAIAFGTEYVTLNDDEVRLIGLPK